MTYHVNNYIQVFDAILEEHQALTTLAWSHIDINELNVRFMADIAAKSSEALEQIQDSAARLTTTIIN